jgi:hypothetical protein
MRVIGREGMTRQIRMNPPIPMAEGWLLFTFLLANRNAELLVVAIIKKV